MPEVVYYVAVSIDGYVATSDGGIAWLAPFESSDEDYGYSEFYRSVDGVVLGSHTYEQALAFPSWPYPEKPCWVFSRRQLPVSHSNLTVTSKIPSEVMSELEALGLRRIWLVGGGALAASFRSLGFITEYVISVVPVILGGGIPLFAGSGATESLKLVESKSYSSGIVQVRYLRPNEV